MGAETHLTVEGGRWAASPAGIFALWAGVLGGPIAWAGDLITGYALAPWTCGHHITVPLHLLSLAALAAVGLAAWASMHALSMSSEREPGGNPVDLARDEGIAERAQFMARLGLASSAFFAIVVIATEIPRLFDLCR